MKPADNCPTCGRSEDLDDVEWNYTYNVSGMWSAVFPGEKMVQIEGLTGRESLKKLNRFYVLMHIDPEKFKRMDPSNGWGSYESFLQAIERLMEYATEHPDAIWGACR